MQSLTGTAKIKPQIDPLWIEDDKHSKAVQATLTVDLPRSIPAEQLISRPWVEQPNIGTSIPTVQRPVSRTIERMVASGKRLIGQIQHFSWENALYFYGHVQ